MELGSVNQASAPGTLSESAVYVFDSDCRYLQSAEEAQGGIAGRTPEEIFSAAEARLLRPYYLRALAGQASHVEQREGSVFTHHAFAPLPAGCGSGGIHSLHRWSPGAESARAVNVSDLQFEVIFEQAHELKAILSPQGRLKNANRTLLRLLGCRLDEVREQFFWNLPCWKHNPESPARLRSAILLAGDQQDVRYEETIQGPGRRAKILDLSVKPIFSPGQKLLGLSVEGRDITPLKQAQQLAEKTSQMLLHHNRQLENFAHITSHNLRAPATNIHMLLSYYDNAQNPQEQEYALRKLGQSSLRLLETLDILSDNLSIRMDANVARAELSFEAALARNLELLAAQLMEAEAEIIADFSLCPTIEYPPSYLDSILINLLSNAIKYRHPERRPLIRLHSWQEHQRVNLRVSDNGLGINLARHQDKIFGLYKTFHRNPEARGVGLFLIKSQIEALGGSIRVKSEPNQGTTFHIAF